MAQTLHHGEGFPGGQVTHLRGLADFNRADQFTLNSAGLLRTARKLADWRIYVSPSVWKGF
ncbi:hypothetical protein P279_29240 [Rhodobacteraceae bacterium PD-2]|nr:hypothetical protein P279_29240 [Rhodobacteraceae bacterium PD-2]